MKFEKLGKFMNQFHLRGGIKRVGFGVVEGNGWIGERLKEIF